VPVHFANAEAGERFRPCSGGGYGKTPNRSQAALAGKDERRRSNGKRLNRTDFHPVFGHRYDRRLKQKNVEPHRFARGAPPFSSSV
jgi:hypothetical protein